MSSKDLAKKAVQMANEESLLLFPENKQHTREAVEFRYRRGLLRYLQMVRGGRYE